MINISEKMVNQQPLRFPAFHGCPCWPKSLRFRGQAIWTRRRVRRQLDCSWEAAAFCCQEISIIYIMYIHIIYIYIWYIAVFGSCRHFLRHLRMRPSVKGLAVTRKPLTKWREYQWSLSLKTTNLQSEECLYRQMYPNVPIEPTVILCDSNIMDYEVWQTCELNIQMILRKVNFRLLFNSVLAEALLSVAARISHSGGWIVSWLLMVLNDCQLSTG